MPTEAPGGPEPQSPSAAAAYIATLTAELTLIARSHRFEALAYILDMARMEADQIARSSADGCDPGGTVS